MSGLDHNVQLLLCRMSRFIIQYPKILDICPVYPAPDLLQRVAMSNCVLSNRIYFYTRIYGTKSVCHGLSTIVYAILYRVRLTICDYIYIYRIIGGESFALILYLIGYTAVGRICTALQWSLCASVGFMVVCFCCFL